ncbi:multicopper oxidase family protein [Phreatobacter sp. AB_2022a]|uniref:multicopper oxidase family protein n=1 Tax=Phreatobacter sp. AB_2022a TaxID=3003134 RepID=UPI002286F4F6|nr:multicopper oxidase family protein [Phreatobacter sp. AB_2022a]MCZ0735416.1 multicopper oxidase family protein [Phreatobacter sp. AB_2022a]
MVRSPSISRRRALHALGALAGSAALAPVFADPALRTLTALRGEARLRGPDEAPTPIWGFDGAAPGPVLRARRGEPFRLRFVNGLDEPTALHWQGLRIDNRMDGVPGLTQDAVAPGGASEIAFTPRDAGTFLYRPWHPEFGVGQVARGLAGLFIVDGPNPPEADRELAFVLDDWALDASGAVAAAGLPLAAKAAPGTAGRHLTVNGAPTLALAARANERLWLRLANATPARILQFGAPGQPVTLVALDGQPCEPFPLEGGTIALGPGQRAELMLDVTGAPGATMPLVVSNLAGATLEGRIAIAAEPPARPEPLGAPAPLAANPIAAEMDFRRAFRLDLGIEARAGTTVFNGRADRAPPPQPAFKVRRGTVVMAGLRNATDRFQALHLHGHQARLLDGLDDGWKPFFVDTVVVPPGRTSRVAFLADNPGKWVISAQPIGTADGPLVTWFEVG